MNYWFLATAIAALAVIGAVMMVAMAVHGSRDLRRPICKRCGADLRQTLRIGRTTFSCAKCNTVLAGDAAVSFRRRPGSAILWASVLVCAAGGIWLHLNLPVQIPTPEDLDDWPQVTQGNGRGWWDLSVYSGLKGFPEMDPVTASDADLDKMLRKGCWFLDQDKGYEWRHDWEGAVMELVWRCAKRGHANEALVEEAYERCERDAITLRAKHVVSSGSWLSVTGDSPADEDEPHFSLLDVYADNGHPLQVRVHGDLGEDSSRRRCVDHEVLCNLPPGEHEITCVFRGEIPVAALAARDTWREADTSAAPPSTQPALPPKLQWTTRIKHQLLVVPPGQPAVRWVTDPRRNPFPQSETPRPLVIVDSSKDGKKVLVIRLERPLEERVERAHDWAQVAAKAFAVAEGKEHELGAVAFFDERYIMPEPVDAAFLPAGTSAVDVVLRPSAEVAESNPDISSAWGKEIRFEKVPVIRRDLLETP